MRVTEAFLGTFSHGTRWTPSRRPRCERQANKKPAKPKPGGLVIRADVLRFHLATFLARDRKIVDFQPFSLSR